MIAMPITLHPSVSIGLGTDFVQRLGRPRLR